MRIPRVTYILLAVALLGSGFYKLAEHSANTALRGNARTLYRPSSFPVQQARIASSKQDELKRSERTAVAVAPKTPDKQPANLRNAGGNKTPPTALIETPERGTSARTIAKPVQSPPRELVLYRPVALDGATLSDTTKRILLRHVKPLELTETCPSEDHERWPCGNRARTALRTFIGQKRITCTDMSKLRNDAYAASCKAGRHDLATWLVENGWVKTVESAPNSLKKTAQNARLKEQGMWRSKLVALNDKENATLVTSWEELGENLFSRTPLIMEGEPNIIWRPRHEVSSNAGEGTSSVNPLTVPGLGEQD